MAIPHANSSSEVATSVGGSSSFSSFASIGVEDLQPRMRNACWMYRSLSDCSESSCLTQHHPTSPGMQIACGSHIGHK
eukprot:CAMPEP_0115542746 /NCGR_PEP_ID=MMETSP0271-20121206/91171_1 /TAXON_ID=71861 /ORGANISM="Scrippsiella trochoidea, Strain CCMP3099" /LENGTH=77 /DNA_ID=CAMNT_0002975919 /DNA_START=106 /DNA_END=336 /DNA_ORIENTATION=-